MTTSFSPIFILGRQHSGNTMLALILGRFARVYSQLGDQAFAWENGAVNQYYWDGERVRRRSFALIHLQRRRMCPPAADVKEASGWYILPDRFLPKAHDPRGPADLRQLNPRAPWRDLTWQLLRPYRKLRRLARNRALLRNAR